VAFNDKEAFEGFTSCRNEARNSFGDDRVFIEKYVLEPRHIEIQILGDSHGNVLYLNERECSIQRRHQKVIEEAPSPFISEATRKSMGEQAVALAKAVNYQSAGTVEFVVGADQSFYFLEMNTRLQVEHPVTECITGLDLVELMIRIAAGELLPITQDQVLRRGWAIECRINAEDPFRNFLPSIGRLVKFQPPVETLRSGIAQAEPQDVGVGVGVGVRVDTGVTQGGEISMHYDSMIAKLIVHGRDRSDAIARMREALNAFVIRGIESNIPFQAALLAHPDFVAGRFNTGFIAQHFPQGFKPHMVRHESPELLYVLAAATHRLYRERADGISGQSTAHTLKMQEQYVVIQDLGGGHSEHRQVHVRLEDGEVVVTLDQTRYQVAFCSSLRDTAMHMRINGRPLCAQVERRGLSYRIRHDGAEMEFKVLSPRAAELSKLMPFKAPPDRSKFLLSPMPGLLSDVCVQAGQPVVAGQKLAVIEAMKMENILLAAQDGVVSEVVASKGDSLAVDQVILRFA
jgi:propionyl-CoA carboxylase alpha chain